ncbi:LysR family transcriptional regulator [Bordetella genomosp. 13]|uniref:LysR family transcriptional regulator n=1 Tax=Bordetella genomosp. 13 TaxID=463040 RepID=UPI0011A797AD|nr:LysR family transcriptional regulator [Bordetella genomosp. 13]
MSGIRNFRTFIEVVRHGSFAAASEHVCLTPAAVGLQIQALENELGFALFDRVGRSVTLNRRGHAMLPMARQMVALYESMRAQDPEQQELAGTIRLATIATSMKVVVRAVLAMRRAYPRLEVQPGISYSGDLIERIKEGTLDAALSVKGHHRPPAGVLWTRLYEEPIAFMCSAQAARQAGMEELLATRMFLRVSRSSTTGTLIDELVRGLHLKHGEFIEMNSMRTIADLVRDDLGVTILPVPSSVDWERDPQLHVQRLDDARASRVVGLFEGEGRTYLTSVLREHLLAQQA